MKSFHDNDLQHNSIINWGEAFERFRFSLYCIAPFVCESFAHDTLVDDGRMTHFGCFENGGLGGV